MDRSKHISEITNMHPPTSCQSIRFVAALRWTRISIVQTYRTWTRAQKVPLGETQTRQAFGTHGTRLHSTPQCCHSLETEWSRLERAGQAVGNLWMSDFGAMWWERQTGVSIGSSRSNKTRIDRNLEWLFAGARHTRYFPQHGTKFTSRWR